MLQVGRDVVDVVVDDEPGRVAMVVTTHLGPAEDPRLLASGQGGLQRRPAPRLGQRRRWTRGCRLARDASGGRRGRAEGLVLHARVDGHSRGEVPLRDGVKLHLAPQTAKACRTADEDMALDVLEDGAQRALLPRSVVAMGMCGDCRVKPTKSSMTPACAQANECPRAEASARGSAQRGTPSCARARGARRRRGSRGSRRKERRRRLQR